MATRPTTPTMIPKGDEVVSPLSRRRAPCRSTATGWKLALGIEYV
jgi:hypothetical protein